MQDWLIQLVLLTVTMLIINPGDGICQFIFQKYFTTEDDESEGTREGGFGSTDK